jgi:putative NADH-flavin reductase
MKVVVFGASGRTGRQIVEQALGRGYQVTAFIHVTGGFEDDARVRTVRGDVLNADDVKNGVSGQDAVLSALGRGASKTPATSAGTRNIINEMQKAGVTRLIVESAFGAGDSARQISIPDRLLVRGVLLRTGYQAKDRMEEDIEKSGLRWTIVRPPRLTDGTRRGHYRAGEHISLNLASGISRADVADFMLNQVEGEDFVGKKPSIGY